jgi:DNA-3-methyladenine glycosylase
MHSAFSAKPAITAPALAASLLGQTLVRHSREGSTEAVITETEAYTYYDKACHGYNNRLTERTKTLFKAPGHWYVYLIYGMHYCVNITAEEEGCAGGVLIRAVKLISGHALAEKRRIKCRQPKNLTNGPGKLCEALAIDRRFNGCDTGHAALCLQTDAAFPALSAKEIALHTWQRTDSLIYKVTERIGIAYAGDDAKRLWRFMAINL